MTAPALIEVAADPMAAMRALNRMRRAGFALTGRTDRLIVSPADRLTALQDDFLRTHKAALVQLLTDAETLYRALQGAGAAGLDWREDTPAEWPESRLLAAGEVLYADGRMVNRLGRRFAVDHAPPPIQIAEYVIPADPPDNRTVPDKTGQADISADSPSEQLPKTDADPVTSTDKTPDIQADSDPRRTESLPPLKCRWTDFNRLVTKCDNPMPIFDSAGKVTQCGHCGAMREVSP